MAQRKAPPARQAKKQTSPPARRSAPQTEQRERNPNRIGALWIKRTSQNTFMSGEVEIDGVKTRILVFKNTYKQSENQPDYNIMLPREDSRRDNPPATEYDDDIPF